MPNTAPLKLPQHSIEVEQSMLGGLLLDNSAWDRIAGFVAEADFYRDDHRRIFHHISRLIEESRPADVVTVVESLEKSARPSAAAAWPFWANTRDSKILPVGLNGDPDRADLGPPRIAAALRRRSVPLAISRSISSIACRDMGCRSADDNGGAGSSTPLDRQDITP